MALVFAHTRAFMFPVRAFLLGLAGGARSCRLTGAFCFCRLFKLPCFCCLLFYDGDITNGIVFSLVFPAPPLFFTPTTRKKGRRALRNLHLAEVYSLVGGGGRSRRFARFGHKYLIREERRR